jgi:acyl carrier protein
VENTVEPNSQDIIQLVNTILHDKFEVPYEKLTATAKLKEDLNLDSLDFVDMFVILEQKLGGTPPENIDFLKIRTLGDIYELVKELAATAKPK